MDNTTLISPKLLKGFRDFHPSQQTLRLQYIDILQQVFSLFGFLPIDTPILEYEETLLGKGGGETDKQVYRFTDQGNRAVAMRFDLTVPFARYVSMNQQELPVPFCRYQIGKVFRGENTQKGRYREFMQCDFDIIGVDTASADATILQVIAHALDSLSISNFFIHISHRDLLNELLQQKHCETQIVDILRILDKIRKIGTESTRAQLSEIVPAGMVNTLLTFCIRENSNEATIKKLETIIGTVSSALVRLKEIIAIAETAGLKEHVIIDPSIMRGLDYYTGFVCETFIHGHEDVGSICSGGRYNNLTKIFSQQDAKGVGASIGLDRLLSVLETDRVTITAPRFTVLFPQEQSTVAYCYSIMNTLHQNNIAAQVYMGEYKLKNLFRYTEKISADYVMVIGTVELQTQTVTIKHQHTREQKTQITLTDVLTWIQHHHDTI